jgi:hypothetical protein
MSSFQVEVDVEHGQWRARRPAAAPSLWIIPRLSLREVSWRLLRRSVEDCPFVQTESLVSLFCSLAIGYNLKQHGQMVFVETPDPYDEASRGRQATLRCFPGPITGSRDLCTALANGPNGGVMHGLGVAALFCSLVDLGDNFSSRWSPAMFSFAAS